MTELLLGCGASREKRLRLANSPDWWTDLVTLDRYPDCNPDVLHDLNELPYPFADEAFSEIHAYCVLEHLGAQGDWRFFFDQWTEFWRILRPDGLFFGISPKFDSPWAWGDPSHTRIIGREQLTFLNQNQYKAQVGKSSMSDFRWFYKKSFVLVLFEELSPGNCCYCLQKAVAETEPR